MSWLLDKSDEELGKLTRQCLEMYKKYDNEQQRMSCTTATMALLGSVIDINAENFYFELFKFHDSDRQFGDWKIKISRVKSFNQKVKDFFTIRKKGLLVGFDATQDLNTKAIQTKETYS